MEETEIPDYPLQISGSLIEDLSKESDGSERFEYDLTGDGPSPDTVGQWDTCHEYCHSTYPWSYCLRLGM